MQEFIVMDRDKRVIAQGTAHSFAEFVAKEVERGRSFQGADLSYTNLSTARLTGGDFRHANFTGSKIEAAWVQDADCEGACFEGTNLNGALFERADLRDTRFMTAYLHRVSFKNADLSRANFEGSTQEGLNLHGATLADVTGLKLLDDYHRRAIDGTRDKKRSNG